jgi:hypothetical protein
MGKTVAAINQLIHSALKCGNDNPRYAYIAPTYGQAKRIAWDYLEQFTRPLDAKLNVSELKADFFGRRIQLYGSDNPDSLRGQYFDGVVIDEIADQDPKIWNEIIRPALADRKGFALFLGTPKGRNHFADWSLLEFKASQTGILDSGELESARKEMGDDKYSQEFECSFSAPVTGSYYGELINDLESRSRICPIPYESLAVTFCGWDLGMSDSTAIWVAQIASKEVRIIDYVENHGVGLDWYVEWLRDKGYEHATQILPHDVQVRELGTGKSRKEMLEEAGLEITVAPRLSVADGIQAVRQLLPRCWFNTDAKQGIDALRNYRREYDEKRAVFYDRPLHDWSSHAADAFRYLAIGLNEGSSSWDKPLNIDTRWVV